jgi:hypothetical protein
MTNPTPNKTALAEGSRSSKARRVILTIVLVLVGAAAFRLSFDAQVTLAIAAGIPDDLAQLYPLVVDAAIAGAMLIGIWVPTLTDGQRRYVWISVGFLTALSVVGNAVSVLVISADRVTMPMAAAVALHAVPAITLFLVVHLSASTVLNPIRSTSQQPARTARGSAPRKSASSSPQRDIPPVTSSELLTMADDQGLSVREIAAQVGRSKTWVAKHLGAARTERQTA